MAATNAVITGACLCGAVRFSAKAGDEAPMACHCEQCRRWSGHYWVGMDAHGLTVQDETHLRWYRSSEFAQRGFCAQCGSSLFWRHDDRNYLDVSAGCIDAPTGLTLGGHIYTAFKGDYYEIKDGLPQTKDD